MQVDTYSDIQITEIDRARQYARVGESLDSSHSLVVVASHLAVVREEHMNGTHIPRRLTHTLLAAPVRPLLRTIQYCLGMHLISTATCMNHTYGVCRHEYAC